MRWILPLLLVAGCTSGSYHGPDMSVGADMASPIVSCPQTLDDYCAAHAGDCIRDFASADMTSTWCGVDAGIAVSATRRFCASSNEFTITLQYNDDVVTYAYANDALVAVFTTVPHGQDLVCIAGPAQTMAPVDCGSAKVYCSP